MIALPIRGRDAEAQFARALVTAARASGLEPVLAELRSRPWASATFVGTRVSLVMVAPRSPALHGWVAALAEAELPMPGHLLASLAVDGIGEGEDGTVRIALTALVIDH